MWFVYYILAIISLVFDVFIVLPQVVGKKKEVSLDECLNPIVVYRANKVNIFGAIVLTLIGHILCIWIVPFFWFYKLCTIGRK